MSRPKGSKNRQKNWVPETITLSPEARLTLLANLIVARIEKELEGGFTLLQEMEAE